MEGVRKPMVKLGLVNWPMLMSSCKLAASFIVRPEWFCSRLIHVLQHEQPCLLRVYWHGDRTSTYVLIVSCYFQHGTFMLISLFYNLIFWTPLDLAINIFYFIKYFAYPNIYVKYHRSRTNRLMRPWCKKNLLPLIGDHCWFKNCQ